MKFIDDINLEKYNDFVTSNYNCNIFQSPQWVDVKNTWGYKRVAVVDSNNQILATAQVLIRKGLWYLPRGPILDYSNKNLLSFFLCEFKKYAKKNKAKLLKIDIPEDLKSAKLSEFKNIDTKENSDEILSIFKNNKFKHTGFSLNMSDTIQPRFEAVCDLNDSYVDNLPKHTKRLLKDVEKRFVEVKQMGLEGLNDFLFAINCTEIRKNIKLRNREYFENLFDLYGNDCIIYTAYIDTSYALEKLNETKKEILADLEKTNEKMHKKRTMLSDRLNSTNRLLEYFNNIYDENNKVKIICSALSVKYGNSSEMLYAGMNYKFSKIPAQYKVYVETMKTFYNMGAKKTSMGGTEGTLDDGLLLFKSHFNPNIVEHYGEFDYAISKTYKLLYDYGLPLRRKLLKLLKK